MKRVFLLLFLWMLVTSTSTHRLQAQWIQMNLPNTDVVSCFAVSGTNLFAGTWGGGVFLSTNNGTTWTAVSSGLPKYSASDTTDYEVIRALAVSDTNLFAGTTYEGDCPTCYYGTVFLSTNNGASWSAVDSG